ncbi:hypothetical protein GEV33_008319 [Tenebrio molitor]|uniref:RNA-directed DNA polymerase n=1 Tax=Tenebrio molitor TaxID=7067 RepID=A0A8J6HJ06_TENMO|nr:hypothetical protein GEV33_008319 [Tenebrio molitor]
METQQGKTITRNIRKENGFKRPRRQEVPLWDESLAADKNHSPLSAWNGVCSGGFDPDGLCSEENGFGPAGEGLDFEESKFRWCLREKKNRVRVMEIAITPELLSRDELVHELVVRGTVVSTEDPLEGLINNLRYYLSAEREGIMFDIKVNLDSDRELTRCKEIVGEIHALFSKVWDEIALRTASSKLAHLRGRLGRITTEQGVQTENKEKLCAELDRGIEALNSRARFLSVASNDSTRANTSGFSGVTSTPGVDQNFGSTPSRTQTNWSHVMVGCATHDISQDDLLRHVKLLLKGEALVWYRMVESRISSWYELCERLKEEFLPIGYSETARDKHLNYRQTECQTIGMLLAHFEQLEGYLPQPLAFADKLTVIRRNILSYYQDRLWDKRVNSLDELYRLCRELDATKFNIDRHSTTQTVNSRNQSGTTLLSVQKTRPPCQELPIGSDHKLFRLRETRIHENYLSRLENECPKLFVSVLGCEFVALLYSGASRVFVGQVGWRKLEALGFKLRRTWVERCTLASNSEVACVGAVNVPLRLEHKVAVFEVLVVPDVRQEMIFGIDFWVDMGIVPNFRQLTWEFADSLTKGQDRPLIGNIVNKFDLTPYQNRVLESCVRGYLDKTRDSPLGCTDLITHKIVLEEGAQPVRARNYRVSPYIQRLIDQEVDEMLKLGVIERAKSEWNSPYLMVPKKDGSYRFVIDFRGVNARSKRVYYPLPNVSHILDSLGNVKYLSSLDIRSAYWEIPLDEESRPLTAFSVTGRGQFQFKRMPFGLHSADGTFQALVDRLFTPDLEPYVFAYLDDIVISTPDFETHVHVLDEVFRRLLKAGLTLKEAKCEFCKSELKFLGYVVNRQGLKVDPLKKKTRFVWSTECERAFSEVKNALISAPILSCPDFNHPFTLQCDAIDIGIGAVLTHNFDGNERVICYLSRALSLTERKYSTTEKECLSVIYAIERLRPLLWDMSLRTSGGDDQKDNGQPPSTYNKISNNHTWPRMRAAVCRYIRRCPVCASLKPEQKYPAGTMGSRPEISRPWQMISADLFGPLPRSTSGHEYVLVITDYFSKFNIFVPVRSPTARKVIDEIEQRVFLMFGVPEFVIVDNGVQFGRSHEFQDFLRRYGVEPYYNSLYTPQNNPTERVNRTLKSLITSYIDQDQRKWDENLSRVACALRTAKHEATRQTPYYLNFGNEMIDYGADYARLRERRDLDTESDAGDETSPSASEREKESRLAKTRQLVERLLSQVQARAKRYYDAKRRQIEFDVVDYVWKKAYPTADGTKHFSAKLVESMKVFTS